MRFFKTALFLVFFMFIFSILSAALDSTKHHTVGNAWLRVSNYGFFGSGYMNPPFPSLEYPGGSGIDYLYYGSLWFGAQKVRKNAQGQPFYWRNWPPHNNTDVITQYIMVDGVQVLHPDWESIENPVIVIDTLTTVGLCPFSQVSELLPIWNPQEAFRNGYFENNHLDVVRETSTRLHRRGFDNDGDGFIDEDPIGRNFPFRRDLQANGIHLPREFHDFSGLFIHELGLDGTNIILDNYDTWYPLGFQDLSYTDTSIPLAKRFTFTEDWDDDGDLLYDEDGAPISEQDYISYFYDYNPFQGPSYAPIRRYINPLGNSARIHTHYPLNIRVRQMSYQWSFEYIQNLTYVEFNITNMNPHDTLYNAVMGIYMDCITGPQSWQHERRLLSDVSGYVSGEHMEFAYTRDKLYPGITPHWIGARVVNPDPEGINYASWIVSTRPKNSAIEKDIGSTNPEGPTSTDPRISKERYHLLSGKNPDSSRYLNMREISLDSPINHYEEELGNFSSFLFAFYGDGYGYEYPWHRTSWNLNPFETMKIVVAIFPGEHLDDLKASARWAKNVYGRSQQLNEVVLPDTFPHYNPPEPPIFPLMYTELVESTPGTNILNLDVYWSNRSEFSTDYFVVERNQSGWQNVRPFLDSYIGNWDDSMPEQFEPDTNDLNQRALVNPFTAWRLRHSFQGYSLWTRVGRGDRDSWMLQERWDKVDSDIDQVDYQVNYDYPNFYYPFQGNIGIDKGLPNRINGDNGYVTKDDISPGGLFHGFCLDNEEHIYTMLDENYLIRPIQEGDLVYGMPIYNTITTKQAQLSAHKPRPTPPFLTDQERSENQLLFKHPALKDEIFLALVDDLLIPLPGHLGQHNIVNLGDPDSEERLDRRYARLSRRYYKSTVYNIPKGREFYVSVSAWNRGVPMHRLDALESGRDANMQVFFPGSVPTDKKEKVYVVPNPYRGGSTFDGVVAGDHLGDRSRRLWFVNLPKRANVQIFTLAGDLVAEFEHFPEKKHDVISISKEVSEAVGSGGAHPWNLISRHNQIIASGLYFFSVKCHDTNDVQLGRFVVIR